MLVDIIYNLDEDSRQAYRRTTCRRANVELPAFGEQPELTCSINALHLEIELCNIHKPSYLLINYTLIHIHANRSRHWTVWHSPPPLLRRPCPCLSSHSIVQNVNRTKYDLFKFKYLRIFPASYQNYKYSVTKPLHIAEQTEYIFIILWSIFKY